MITRSFPLPVIIDTRQDLFTHNPCKSASFENLELGQGLRGTGGNHDFIRLPRYLIRPDRTLLFHTNGKHAFQIVSGIGFESDHGLRIPDPLDGGNM